MFVHEAGFGRQPDAIDEDVIADQQGGDHGRGWNLKGLHAEGDDEQANDQHRSDGGDELRRRFLGVFRLLLRFCFLLYSFANLVQS